MKQRKLFFIWFASFLSAMLLGGFAAWTFATHVAGPPEGTGPGGVAPTLGSDTIGKDASGNLIINRASGKAIKFKENNSVSDQLIIASGGNVGIGASNPKAKLSFSDVTLDSTDGLTWYNSGTLPSDHLLYGIYRTAGPWSSPSYQQLKLNWETGIILNPGSGYSKSYVDVQGGGLVTTKLCLPNSSAANCKTAWPSGVPTDPVNALGSGTGLVGAFKACPSGTKVVGGGCYNPADNNCTLRSSFPNSNGWQCYTKAGSGVGCSIYAYVICL